MMKHLFNMTHGSLFSGIGGFDLAAEWMGWQNIFHCEWNDFGQKVLKYYWPDADSHSDITKTNFKQYANRISVLSGGFPCQPFSLAGKRKGTNDERYLWHEMLRAVQEIKPQFVVAENVFGITNIDGGMVFEQVCADLEAEGYEVQAFVIPAAAKDAPHRRDRVWFVAQNTNNDGWRSNQRKKEPCKRKQRNAGTGNNEWIYTDHEENKNVANTCIGRLRTGSDNIKKRYLLENKRFAPKNKQEWQQMQFRVRQISSISTYTDGCRARGLRNESKEKRTQISHKLFRGKHTISDWNQFPTQPPVCSGNDGLPRKLDGITFSKWRKESIKAYGNAIVPQVAYEIFKAIETMATEFKQ